MLQYAHLEQVSITLITYCKTVRFVLEYFQIQKPTYSYILCRIGMGKTQRYQAAVVGHKKPRQSLAFRREGWRIRRPEPEYRHRVCAVGLLGAVLRCSIGLFSCWWSVFCPHFGDFFFYWGCCLEPWSILSISSAGEFFVFCWGYPIFCCDSASCLFGGLCHRGTCLLPDFKGKKGSPPDLGSHSGLSGNRCCESPF